MMGDAGERQQLTVETSQWYEMLTGFTQSAANVQREYTATLKSASHCVSTETLPYSNSLQLSKLPKNLERYRSFIELYLEILIDPILGYLCPALISIVSKVVYSVPVGTALCFLIKYVQSILFPVSCVPWFFPVNIPEKSNSTAKNPIEIHTDQIDFFVKKEKKQCDILENRIRDIVQAQIFLRISHCCCFFSLF